VTLAMLGYVLQGLQYSAAAYITALTIDFFTVAFAYVIALDVIMQQPMEVSARPPQGCSQLQCRPDGLAASSSIVHLGLTERRG